MKNYHIQLILGNNFEDIGVTANNEVEALKAARKLVQTDPKLSLFKHRYTRYSI